MTLREQIEQLYGQNANELDRPTAIRAFTELKFFLNGGEVRAAMRTNDEHTGGWIVNDWVKKGILLGFRAGELADFSINDQFRYFDKSTFPLKRITLDQQIRIVPGGTTIRDGAYVARNVVMMPPAYINIGAYVDEGTLIDSHVLVGSCAQIGKRVHISAGAQIGGVLEPIGSFPVIIEDDVFIGGNSGVYEGAIIKRRAVLGAGVILTGSTPVYDLVRQTIYRRTQDSPLVIPEGAVVVPGTRGMNSPFAIKHQIAIATPVIIKYRDQGTDAATALEESLR